MKNIIAAALILPLFASANICDYSANVAYAIMDARQSGLPKEDIVSSVVRKSLPETRKKNLELVNKAYAEKLETDPKKKKTVIYQFYLQEQHDCLVAQSKE